MSNSSETFDETESPIRLGTPADCERALARFIRQVHKGSLDHKIGHSLIIGIGTLAKMMRERHEDEALERLNRLEKARAESRPTPPSH